MGWTNHYSPKYDRCYVLVSYLHKGGKAKPPGEPITYNELWDAFERKLLSTCAGADRNHHILFNRWAEGV
jgi:hypothetical protein